LVSERGFGFTF